MWAGLKAKADLILFGLAVLICVSGWAAFAWERNEYQSLELKLSDQKAEAGQQLAAAVAKVGQVQHAHDELVKQIEVNDAKQHEKDAAAAADNQRLLADIDRLRGQPGRGSGGHGPVPASPGGTRRSAGGAAVDGGGGQCRDLLAAGAHVLSNVEDEDRLNARLAVAGKGFADGVSAPAGAALSPQQ